MARGRLRIYLGASPIFQVALSWLDGRKGFPALSGLSTEVIDVEFGRVRRVASGRAPHEVTGTSGARESDPLGWWTALRDAIVLHHREAKYFSV